MNNDNSTIVEIQSLFNFIERATAVKHSIPDSPINDDNSVNDDIIRSFDINSYLQAFDKIKLKRGKVLSYVYAYNRHGGMPYVYAKDITEEPIQDINKFWKQFPQTRADSILGQDNDLNTISTYEKALTFEQSFLGYVQHSLFLWTSNKFFLFWHALYHRRTYFFSKQSLEAQIERIVKSDYTFSPEERAVIDIIDPYPKVLVFDNKVEVYLLSMDSHTMAFDWNKTTYNNGIVTAMDVINIVEERVTVFY